MTAAGLKKIEEIREGDLVLAYDEETGEQAYKPVAQLFRNETKEWYHVRINDEEIICTGGHPFYVLNADNSRNILEFESVKASGTGKWSFARDLKKSDQVLLSDGSCGIIEAIQVEQLETPEVTYNFEVEGFHTYYVGNGVLVHNMNGGGCGGNKNHRIAQKDGMAVDLEYGGSGKANLHLHAKGKKFMFDGIDSFSGAGRLNKTSFVKDSIKKGITLAKKLNWRLK